MKNFSSYILLLLTIVLTQFHSVYAVTNEDHIHDISYKVYVQPQDIIINNEGIFLMTETGVILIQEVHQDKNGIYVLPNIEASYCLEEKHGGKCHYCEGCFKWNCPRRCRCN